MIWTIERASCACGGRYTWMKERESGVLESAGCVCHHDPDIDADMTIETILKAIRIIIQAEEGESITRRARAVMERAT